MTAEQLHNIQSDFKCELIEKINEPSLKKRLYTFLLQDDRTVFIEETKVQWRTKKEPNYYICTNSYDCWDGEDDFRKVYDRFAAYAL